MIDAPTQRVLFVCLGNICRSPLLEAVVREQLQRHGVHWQIASAGTGDWHVGRAADSRAIAIARERGYSVHEHRARQVCADDYRRYAWLLAADRTNLRELERSRPPDATARVALVLAWAGVDDVADVPDPYHGGRDDFAHVIDLAERIAAGILARTREGA